MAVDFDTLVVKVGVAKFGVPVTYIPRLYPRFPMNGVFDRAYCHDIIKDGIAVTETMPVLGVSLSDFPNTPLQGDQLIVAGELFEVRELKVDSHGGGKLMLNFKSQYTNV